MKDEMLKEGRWISHCCGLVSRELEKELVRLYQEWVSGIAYHWDTFFRESWTPLHVMQRMAVLLGGGEREVTERIRRLETAFGEYVKAESAPLRNALETMTEAYMHRLKAMLADYAMALLASSPEAYQKTAEGIVGHCGLSARQFADNGGVLPLPEILVTAIRSAWFQPVIYDADYRIVDVRHNPRNVLQMARGMSGHAKDLEACLSRLEKEICIAALRDSGAVQTLGKAAAWIAEYGEKLAAIAAEAEKEP